MLRNRDKEEEGFKHLEYRVAIRRKKEEKIIVCHLFVRLRQT